MKKTLSFCMVAIMLFAATSCANFKAKHQIHRLESLTEKVEKEGKNFTQEDWKKTMYKYEDICTDMAQCDYTNKQMEQIGMITSRFYIACAAAGFKQIGPNIGNIINKAADAMGNILDGVSDALDETEETSDDIQETTKEVDEALQELNALFE